VHIFWQRRINDGDASTPYWYPCQTSSGAIREDRLVFPIPPGTHWTEVRAVVLPTQGARGEGRGAREDVGQKKPRALPSRLPLTPRPSPLQKASICAVSGLQFGKPTPAKQKAPRERVAKPKVKVDPQLVAKARELRDRYLERVNSEPLLLAGGGKYDVSRAISSSSLAPDPSPLAPAATPRLLPAA
jgi:hypothetical protein